MSSGLNPRVRRTFTVIGHSPDLVELRTGVWNQQSFTLRDETGSGKILNLVCGLDGSLTRRELAKREGVSRADVEAVIDHLYSLGAIEEEPTSALDAYLDTVAPLGGRPELTGVADQVLIFGDFELSQQVGDALTGNTPCPVRVPAADPLWTQLLDLPASVSHDGLELAALATRFQPWARSLVITADRLIDPLRARTLNRLAHQVGFSWIQAAIDGPFLFIGPTVLPHRSACWECFETRVTMNLHESQSYLRYTNALARGQVVTGRPPVLRAVGALLASHAALEATNYLYSGSNFTIEKALGIYLPTMEIAYNEVLPMPGCRGCAPIPERDAPSLYFDARVWLDD